MNLGSFNRMRVQGAVLLLAVLSVTAASASDPSKVIEANFDVHPELEMTLFAEEPLLVNPTNIDVDHLGRVWVCEVLNYRHFRNTDALPRKEGDRILVLEDTDGDGSADKQTVFYQGTDIDSAHGVCVLGDRVIVSAGDKVQVLIDSDGDLKADKKEVLFSGIGGVQHDHGIHAFILPPTGNCISTSATKENKFAIPAASRSSIWLATKSLHTGDPTTKVWSFAATLTEANLRHLAGTFATTGNWLLILSGRFGNRITTMTGIGPRALTLYCRMEIMATPIS